MASQPDSRSPARREATPRTRRAILQLLKQSGPCDAQALAAELGISAMAVRQHLYALQDEQWVTYQEVPRPVGRPAKLWELTPAANRYFPEAYAELAVSLLDSLAAAFGEAGLAQLLATRTAQQIADYQAELAVAETWRDRTARLAALRDREGYMAAVQPDGPEALLLIEHHCPICAAAAACSGLCAQELAVFQAVLGPAVAVERAEHLLAGARRCVYRIVPHGATDR